MFYCGGTESETLEISTSEHFEKALAEFSQQLSCEYLAHKINNLKTIKDRTELMLQLNKDIYDCERVDKDTTLLLNIFKFLKEKFNFSFNPYFKGTQCIQAYAHYNKSIIIPKYNIDYIIEDNKSQLQNSTKLFNSTVYIVTKSGEKFTLLPENSYISGLLNEVIVESTANIITTI